MRVLVIGLDGATFDLIRPWTDQQQLPTFKMLMENGVYGDLISTIPPVTSPAWPSFMTGKNPGKHDVFDFVGRSGEYSREIKNARDIKAKTLWKLLSEAGKTCVVVNVPVTYPPEEINGCIVTGMLTPPNACYAYPPEIYEELQKIGYKPELEIKKRFSPKKLLDYLVEAATKRVQVFFYLMERFDWDFCMLVFRGTDVIQHELWQYHQKEILQFYRKVDSLIKELIMKAGSETNVILMSDHGFGPVYKFFHVNYLLHKLGLLEFKTESSSGKYLNIKDYRFQDGRLKSVLLKIGITKETVYTMAEKTRTLRIFQKLYKKLNVQIPTTKKAIDWKRTKAFFNSSIGPASSIQINLEGRETEGIVKKDEYEKVRKFIMSELREVVDPETGQKIVQDVFRREDLYSGPYVSDAPDIIFLTNNFEYAATDRIYGDKIVSEPVHKGRGTHRMNGIFVAYGPDIKDTGEDIGRARITDLAPTILHMFNLEIPEDMDGKVLTDIFNPDSPVAKTPIRYRKTTDAEKERIKERIKKLKGFGKVR